MDSASLQLDALRARPQGWLPFPARRLPVYRADVLVVGSGVAGCCAALAAAGAGAHVMLVSKGRLEDTNTRYAQGGIAAAVGPEDRIEFHAGDTLRAGRGLADPEVVETLVAEGPGAIEELLAAGMEFDRREDGAFDLGREGGHRSARILHAQGTATGLELQRTLGARLRSQASLDWYEHVMAVDLLRDAEGRIAGILALMGNDAHDPGMPVLIEAGATVLATGGGGQIYRETTNPQLATADGLAMALRAGARLRDLEFVQFHPTILYLAGAARFLISEVVRGAGAVLRDRHGLAFMKDYHPDAELAPRDVVSRAIFRRMIETGDTHVYLDLREVPAVGERFPELARITREFGIDIRRDPIPVRPAVHYMIGGIEVDLDGRTSLPGLWATGECASSGLHGANRMGSNSLLEGLTHGPRTGRSAAGDARAVRRLLLPRPARGPLPRGVELSLTDMVYSLKSLMWRQVGIERDGEGLEDALRRIVPWEGYLARLAPFSRAGVEVANMVQAGLLITASALLRRESRGAHYRRDHPELDPCWRCHTIAQADAGGVHLEAPLRDPEAVPGSSGSGETGA